MYLKDKRGVVEVLDADSYKATHPDADLATCGHCGRTWDDAVGTSWTPAPSARCPFEYDHHEDVPALGGALTLTINTGNAAMSTHEDIADALERAAGAIRLRAESPDSGMVMDVNGNKVGEWHLPALPPEE